MSKEMGKNGFHIIDGQWAECDLCGAKACDAAIYCSEHYLHLCADCIRKLKQMPEPARANIENYLLGNVF